MKRDLTNWPFARLVFNLTDYLDEQLTRQGDFRIHPKGAILHTSEGILLVSWRRNPELHIERLEYGAIKCPNGIGPLLPAHPPNLDCTLMDIYTAPTYPLRIAYSISGGVLCGRAGYVKINGETEFEDDAKAIS